MDAHATLGPSMNRMNIRNAMNLVYLLEMAVMKSTHASKRSIPCILCLDLNSTEAWSVWSFTDIAEWLINRDCNSYFHITGVSGPNLTKPDITLELWDNTWNDGGLVVPDNTYNQRSRNMQMFVAQLLGNHLALHHWTFLLRLDFFVACFASFRKME